MRRPEIIELVAILKQRYRESYEPYGTSDREEEGTGFRIAGIEATFSVMCAPEARRRMYDIQIESFPPGEYLYNDIVDLEGLLATIEKFRAPSQAWPLPKTEPF